MRFCAAMGRDLSKSDGAIAAVAAENKNLRLDTDSFSFFILDVLRKCSCRDFQIPEFLLPEFSNSLALRLHVNDFSLHLFTIYQFTGKSKLKLLLGGIQRHG